MRQNKKGFTLVELLAVIVILAVVMLIAVTSVGPMMEKSRKSALGDEGIAMVDAAKAAVQAEQMNSSSKIKATTSVCFDLKYLNQGHYFEKGEADGYYGSVLVKRTNTGTFEYKFWLTNSTYTFKAQLPNSIDVENKTFVDDYKTEDAYNGAAKINSCGQAVTSGAVTVDSVSAVYCTVNGTNLKCGA